MFIDGKGVQMKLCYHCMHQIEKEDPRFCPKCGHSLDSEPADEKYLRPGTILQGKFIVGYPLGAGGFGNTYIGWNQTLFCKVAIKEFYPKQYCRRAPEGAAVMVSDEKLQGRFQRGLRQFLEEARSVAALQDIPGVVKISDFFEENGTGYIVMEHLDGMDVKEILSRSGGKKEYGWCRRVVLTVLHTLREIHKRGVLHRDIAPDNIFVTDEGIIKLIDFGAAKHVSALSDSESDIMLKVGYAPIEQYKRSAAQGPYTDLYGVAALFYRMLTGQRPIPANERLEQDGLITPSDMGIQIPEQAEMGMMVCLNVQPEYRLQSADEFMEALDGRYFTPVYEAEWILPPLEEKKGFREKLSRIPTAAGAGLCIGCICLIGMAVFGAVRSRDKGAEEAALTDTAIVMTDLSGMTEEEAAANVEELEKKAEGQGIILSIGFETDGYIFDLDKEKDGTVASQTVEPLSVLYDPNAEEQEELEGLERDDEGNISGTVSCVLYSDTKLHYGDISGMNAYEMAQKLGIDPGDGEHFIGTDEVEDSCYYDLIRLETPDGEMTAETLRKKKNRKKEITYKKDRMCIVYSNVPFFYWESLPDFKQAYGTLDQIPLQDTYIWKNESERELTDQKRSLGDISGIVDKSHCVIAASETSKGLHKGDILDQTFAAGKELDTSRTEMEDALLYVIGEEIFYSGKSGERLEKEVTERWGQAVNVVAGGSKVMTQPVLSVKVADEKGTPVEYFRKGDAVTVTLDLKPVSAPAPAQSVYPDESAPDNSSPEGGGSSAASDPGGSTATGGNGYEGSGIRDSDTVDGDIGDISGGADDPGGGEPGGDSTGDGYMGGRVPGGQAGEELF